MNSKKVHVPRELKHQVGGVRVELDKSIWGESLHKL